MFQKTVTKNPGGSIPTLPQKFFEVTRTFSSNVALRWKENKVWKGLSYSQFQEKVVQLSKAIMASGIQSGDHVVIFANNSPLWAISDFAILSSGAVTIPIYSTSSVQTVEYIIDQCHPKLVFVGDGECANTYKKCEVKSVKSLFFSEIESFTKKEGTPLDGELEKRIQNIQDEDIATIIYTSGTTGNPKGVMLTHQNIFSNCEAANKCFKVIPTDRTLSFLPLSHALERMSGHFLMFFNGVTVSYAENMETIPQNMREVHPTIFFTVPRVLEKTYAKVIEGISKKPKWMQMFLKTFIFSKWIGKKVNQNMGGAIRLIVSGGAPLSPEINRFFWKIGMPVIEGYGLTETSPVISVNRLDQNKIGTVGKPLPGVEVKIAQDGELIVRGPNVMKGYYKNEEATHEAIDAQGWFHTGDIGEIDSDGFIKITDRKKDLIVTSGGKKVAPQPIENEIKLSHLIGQVALVGDQKKYIVALIVPSKGATEPEIQEVIDRVNSKLAHFEQIKKFGLLPKDWTIESGELTPTQKVKRKFIEKKYSKEIESLY